MRLISREVFLRSILLTLVLFCGASLLFSFVEAFCYAWFGTEKMDRDMVFWETASAILVLSVLFGFNIARGNAPAQKKPVVLWLLVIPSAFFFATILAMLHNICYLVANTAVVYGFAETVKVPEMVMDIYWKSGNPIYEPAISFQMHPILTSALFVSLLFGYYGRLRKSVVATNTLPATDLDNWPPSPKRAV